MVVLVILSGLAISVCAEESANDKLSTNIVLKGTFVKPHHGEAYFAAQFCGYWHYKWFGSGIDVTDVRRKGWTQLSPYLTANRGSFYALVGFQADSDRTHHVQTGLWYVNRFKKFNVFLDVRNFWAVSNNTFHYLDVWLSLSHPITPVSEKLFAGVELEYIHYWTGPSHNWYFVGPFVGYQFTKNISAFVRLSREWDVCSGIAEPADSVRVGVKFTF